MNDYEELDLKFSYWLTNNGQEIDLVVSRGRGRPLAAIEIKSARHIEEGDLAVLEKIEADYPKILKMCFCRTPTAYKTKSGVRVLPWQEGLAQLRML